MFSLLFANSLRENPTIYLLKQNQVIRSINASFFSCWWWKLKAMVIALLIIVGFM